MISHDFVQTGLLGSMINNAKCSWYFPHLILAPCPGLVKRLTLISQPATLKLKENSKKNHIGAKVSSSFLSQEFNNIIHLHFWPRFKYHREFSALKTNRFQQSKTWRIKTFHVHLGSKIWNKTHQNMDQRIKGRSKRRKSAPFYLSRVTFWCWYVWLTELSTLLLCAELCRLRSLWPHCFVDSSWREKEVLEVWRKACLGSFLNVIRWFCVVLFDYF